MAFKLFKRTKVENSADLEGMSVMLPKSKKEMTLEQMINEMDTIQNMDGYANMDHMVKIHDGSEMKVGDLVAKHKAMCDEMEKAKGEEGEEEKKNEDEEIEDGSKEVGDRGGDKSLDNKEDEVKPSDEEKEVEMAKKKNAADKKAKDKAKADKLRNANSTTYVEEVVPVDFSDDKVARGKSRYGASK